MSEESPARSGVPPRLTVHNFATFNYRLKKLPPDANTSAATNTKLYQFNERVCFTCAKCRRDNVQSDSVAMDVENRVILCTACFTRIIRPRTYRPSRVVPFPSLLSWLKYEPSKAMSDIAENVVDRPAEAVAPSGERVALMGLTSGSRSTPFSQLPAIAMNVVKTKNNDEKLGRGDANSYESNLTNKFTDYNRHNNNFNLNNNDANERHPCLRVWGVCQHGSTCLFRNAPRDLCLAYLLGLCHGGDGVENDNNSENNSNTTVMNNSDKNSEIRASKSDDNMNSIASEHPNVNDKDRAMSSNGNSTREYVQCGLLHQKIYDLPQHVDVAPAKRYANDLTDQNSPWMRWLERRQNSPNSAEWQLMNNGTLDTLISTYVPLSPQLTVATDKNGNLPESRNENNVNTAFASKNDSGKEAKSFTENNKYYNKLKAEVANEEVKLKFSDIMTALQQVKEAKANQD